MPQQLRMMKAIFSGVAERGRPDQGRLRSPVVVVGHDDDFAARDRFDRFRHGIGDARRFGSLGQAGRWQRQVEIVGHQPQFADLEFALRPASAGSPAPCRCRAFGEADLRSAGLFEALPDPVENAGLIRHRIPRFDHAISQHTFAVLLRVRCWLWRGRLCSGSARRAARLWRVAARTTWYAPLTRPAATSACSGAASRATVSAVSDNLATEVEGGRPVVFAMNAGMFQPDLSPVGLFIERGQELRPVNRRGGKGNFNLQPNGVFCVRQGVAASPTRRITCRSTLARTTRRKVARC